MLLIHRGRILEENLRREEVDLEELFAALREHGLEGPEQVLTAFLEMDGTISVVPMETPVTRRLRRVRSSRNR